MRRPCIDGIYMCWGEGEEQGLRTYRPIPGTSRPVNYIYRYVLPIINYPKFKYAF